MENKGNKLTLEKKLFVIILVLLIGVGIFGVLCGGTMILASGYIGLIGLLGGVLLIILGINILIIGTKFVKNIIFRNNIIDIIKNILEKTINRIPNKFKIPIIVLLILILLIIIFPDILDISLCYLFDCSIGKSQYIQ